MTAEIIELRPDLTRAQYRRLARTLHRELATPACSTDAHLVNDLAQFVGKIRLLAFVAGAAVPQSRKRVVTDSGGSRLDYFSDEESGLDRVFQEIHDDAQALMFKAIDDDDRQR